MTASAFGPRAKILALVLALSMAGGSLLFAVPSARAELTDFAATPGLYSKPTLPRHPFVYVPGEVMTFTLMGSIPGEMFDAPVIVRSTGQILQPNNNVSMPSNGVLTLSYTVPPSLPDGDDYQIEVGTVDFIENGRPFFMRLALQRFAIQAYEFAIEVDRPAYIGGDDVIITWSANNLRDGSLAPDGFGQIWVFDTGGVSLITPSVFTFPGASGSEIFTLPDLADPTEVGIVFGWFNDSASNPIRFQQGLELFEIDSLGVLVDVTPNQYAPGGIVNVEVLTVVTTNQANPSPFDPPEPDISVDLTVWELTGGGPVEQPQYAASGLITDQHGQLTYVFKLEDNVADGTDFEVRANASHKNGIWRWEGRDTFSVSVAAGLTLVLQFDRGEYQAGDTATVTAIVSGAGGATLTYIYQVRDTTVSACSAAFPLGGLLATDTRGTNTFSYAISENFDGRICFRVTADDGAGNRVTSAREFAVVFGWLLVNANPQEYNPGQTVTVTWQLTSNRITDPEYFYEVRDADGNLATSGTAVSSFQFLVPDPASDVYTFRVTATQAGRSLSGSLSVFKVSGFFLTIAFDRPAYAPGETITVSYAIAARSADDTLPSTFRFIYGLGNGPLRFASTSRPSGQLTYVVPSGIDEGSQAFLMDERNTGSTAVEVLEIRGTNPLWFVTLGDIPVFSLLLLFLIVLLFLLLWRQGALSMGPKVPAEGAPEAPARPEPVHAPPTSPMTVTCTNCSSPIEITTSKRPIEVMCPKCGNTEMVE